MKKKIINALIVLALAVGVFYFANDNSFIPKTSTVKAIDTTSKAGMFVKKDTTTADTTSIKHDSIK